MSICRISCSTSTSAVVWDEEVASLGGSFSHSYGFGQFDALTSNAQPIFIQGFDDSERCVGIAVGKISSSRYWPFSRISKTASFGALPITSEQGIDAQSKFIEVIEGALRKRGVAVVRFASYDSPESADTLQRCRYHLNDRAEFYLNLSDPIDHIWSGLTSERRNRVRFARKRSADTRIETSLESVRLLLDFQAESLRRRGVAQEQRQAEHAIAIKELLIDPGKAELLITYFDGRPTNAALFTIFRSKIYYSYSGSSRLGNDNAGPAHLIWTMIERSHFLGRTVLNLGGAAFSPAKDDADFGLHRFKRDFGATIVRQPAGTKSISRLGSTVANGLDLAKRAARHLRVSAL